MLNPAKDDTWYDPAKVKEFMGVEPHQVADLLALKGDAVDNIPGAPGIGEKGAKDLIDQFGSVEAALDRAAEVTKRMYRESLQNNRDRILMSLRPCDHPLRRADPVRSRSAARAGAGSRGAQAALQGTGILLASEGTRTLGRRPAARFRVRSKPPRPLAAFVAGVPKGVSTGVSLALAFSSDMTEVGLACRTSEARSLPVSRLSELQSALEDASLPKAAADLKSLTLSLLKRGIQPRGFARRRLALRLPARCRSRQLLARSHGRAPPRSPRRPPRRRARPLHPRARTSACAPKSTAAACASSTKKSNCRWPVCWRAWSMTGIRIDTTELARLSALMETEIARLTSEIHALAGREFNIASPQQLGKVLFEEMGLPAPVRYGKGKTISTAADVLEALAAEHEIVRKVLEYRQLTKLKGHLRRRPAGPDRPRHRPHPHQLQPDRRSHRTPVVVESQSAEHPDQDRTRPRDPRRLHPARGLEAGGGRLFADRASPAGPHVAGPGADRRLPQAAKTSTRARRPK